MKMRGLFAVIALGMGCAAGFLFSGDAYADDVVQVPPPREQPSTTLYTAYNIWYEKPDAIFSINYHVGAIVTAGTEVMNIRTGMSRRRMPTVSFQVVGAPQDYVIHFQKEYHPSLTFEQFASRLFTTADFDTLTLGMTPQEVKCIKQGLLEPGLRKNAVLVAYGYPPEHQTPTLDRNIWYYWEKRFDRVEVSFSDRGFLETWQYQ